MLLFTDTEIDWETYMYHIELYRNGERNYEKIEGPTGLLVCVSIRFCKQLSGSQA